MLSLFDQFLVFILFGVLWPSRVCGLVPALILKVLGLSKTIQRFSWLHFLFLEFHETLRVAEVFGGFPDVRVPQLLAWIYSNGDLTRCFSCHSKFLSFKHVHNGVHMNFNVH